MLEESIILFMSDNVGNRHSAMSGESNVSNLNLPASNSPYSGGKGTIYAGGCRVAGVDNYATTKGGVALNRFSFAVVIRSSGC